MENKRLLTKSRFKLAYECETKLFYTSNPEYADQSIDDSFLMELAKGGYQVGELAKYYFSDHAEQITVKATPNDEALKETRKRIERGDRFIAEAAVLFENLFIRVDIFEIDTTRKLIRLFEVKSKSWSSETDFYNYDRKTKEPKGLSEKWKSYLYDIAFQKYVVMKAFPGYTIESFLTLVNKDATATVEGLNQLFRVKKNGKSFEVIPEPGITRERLGKEVLINVPADEAIARIFGWKVSSEMFPEYSFEDYIRVLASHYEKNEKINTPVSKECRKCTFWCKTEEEKKKLKSGLRECWTKKLRIPEQEFEKPKILELSLLYAPSLFERLKEQNKYFIENIEESDIFDKPDKATKGLSNRERKWEQVKSVTEPGYTFFLDKENLKKEMNSWTFPLHFIDFETSMPALPFTKGAHPYEGVAFQYSHHIVRKTPGGGYTVEHHNQFLDTTRGVNPNLNFIRELKKDLSKDNGTIFRYHRHENNYLRMIYDQLSRDSSLADRQELMEFIESITENKISNDDSRLGERNMVDMWELVLRYFYPAYAKGSTSLKQILPSAIQNSAFLREKYSKPVYGIGKEVSSLNFDSQVWIREECGNDPYKTLPPVFEDYSREQLDEMFGDMDNLADGGAAMMAYAKLQFMDTPEDQRKAIGKALLKYCELDTLAMVMLWEFWHNEIN